jgi:hypothetical protein
MRKILWHCCEECNKELQCTIIKNKTKTCECENKKINDKGESFYYCEKHKFFTPY